MHSLSDDRKRQLLDMGFDPNPQALKWDARLKELAQYTAEHGDCGVACGCAEKPQLAG